MYNFSNNSGIQEGITGRPEIMKNIPSSYPVLHEGFSTASNNAQGEETHEIRGGNRFPHIHTSNSIFI